MPTAARLTAALSLAALAWYVSSLIPGLMPEGVNFGWFNEVNAVLGFITGWLVIGSRAGRGWSASISNGLTGVAAMVFWCLFVQACNEMVRLAMKNRYDGPVEALSAIFEIGVEWGALMFSSTEVIVALVVGALIAGLLSEQVSRHWR